MDDEDDDELVEWYQRPVDVNFQMDDWRLNFDAPTYVDFLNLEEDQAYDGWFQIVHELHEKY